MFSSKFGTIKWVLGQESHLYALCLGVSFQGQLKFKRGSSVITSVLKLTQL